MIGLMGAWNQMVKQSSYQYRYNNDPSAEYGYHMGTQAGDEDLAIWNFMDDARKAGIPYEEAIRQLNAGMSGYSGYSPIGKVTGNDLGVSVHVPTHNGDSYYVPDLNEEVRQYQKNLYYRNLMQQSKRNMPTLARPARNSAAPNIPGIVRLGGSNTGSGKEYMQAASKVNKELAQQYYDKNLAGKPMTRYQLMGPSNEYAQTARVYQGGRMGMTVDPVKTRANIRSVQQEGPQGRVRTMPSGHQTLNYGGKHGGAKFDINQDGSVNLRV